MFFLNEHCSRIALINDAFCAGKFPLIPFANACVETEEATCSCQKSLAFMLFLSYFNKPLMINFTSHTCIRVHIRTHEKFNWWNIFWCNTRPKMIRSVHGMSIFAISAFWEILIVDRKKVLHSTIATTEKFIAKPVEWEREKISVAIQDWLLHYIQRMSN